MSDQQWPLMGTRLFTGAVFLVMLIGKSKKMKHNSNKIGMTRINKLKLSIVRASFLSGEGHIPSALSILDILLVLYDRVLKFDPKKTVDPKRDRFVLSKGHGSLGLYAILADKGFFPKKHLESFGQFDSILGGHPDSLKVPGVEVSTGSLG